MFKRRIAAVLVTIATFATVMTAVMAQPASATTGELGGLDLAGYCQGLGDFGTTATGPVILTQNAITGPNFAYNNWACVENNGTVVPITATGKAPSMTDACTVQYPGAATYAYPTDPNDAYTWNCYLLPPAAGPNTGQELQAAVSALMSNDAVQAEVTQLQGLVSAGQNRQALVQGTQFLFARSTQELINDVLGGYKLTQYQRITTAELGAAMTKAVLHQ